MSKTRLTVLICLSLFSALLIILLVLTYRMLRIKRRQAKILSKNQEVKNKLLSLVPAISDSEESDRIKEIIETMDDVPKMTGREMEVVKLCCDGLTSKEIAGKLNVSVRTVDAHKGNIFKKLKISSTVELIRYAVKAGLYTADNQ